MTRRLRTLLAALAAGAIALPAAAHAAPGDPDPSFAGDGSASLGPGRATDVLLGPRGAVLVAGTSRADGTGRFAVARLTRTGVPDPSFGGDDGIATPVAQAEGETSRASVLAPAWGGRVLAAGVVGAEATGSRLVVVRLLADGTPDPTFAGDGVQEVALPPDGRAPRDEPAALTQLPDGRVAVLVAGEAAPLLIRLTHGGAPDPSLDDDGVRALEERGQGVTAAVFDRAGRATVGAESFDEAIDPIFTFTRYTAAGEVDVTFGSGGTTRGAPPDASFVAPNDVVLAPDLDVVSALGIFTPANSNDTGLVRLAANGALDPTFGDGGVLQRDLAPAGLDPLREPPNDSIGDLALTSGGRIVGVGLAQAPGGTPEDYGSLAIRTSREGVLDRTFGDGGVVYGPVGQSGSAVAVQADGRVVVATTDVSAGDEAPAWGVSRLQGDRADLRTTILAVADQARVGEVIRLTVRVENSGPQPAYDAVLDVGTSGLRAVLAEPRPRLGRLDPGEQVTVTARVQIVGGPGTLVLRPRLRSAVLDPDPGDDAPRVGVQVLPQDADGGTAAAGRG